MYEYKVQVQGEKIVYRVAVYAVLAQVVLWSG